MNSPDEVVLREVREEDLHLFCESTTLAYWHKLLEDETIIKKTILVGNQVAGNIVCVGQEGQVSYWLGQAFAGIATQALKLFLAEVTTRPLHAYVAKRNLASRRVLEQCGFSVRLSDSEELCLRLD